jgi:hypothetical protein
MKGHKSTATRAMAPLGKFGHGYALTCPRCRRQGHGVCFEERPRPSLKRLTRLCLRCRRKLGYLEGWRVLWLGTGLEGVSD